jgi:hypothetical protein
MKAKSMGIIDSIMARFYNVDFSSVVLSMRRRLVLLLLLDNF